MKPPDQQTKSSKNGKDPVLAQIVTRLVKHFRPEYIYLFGSRAKNAANTNSDYDLLIVVHESKVPAYRRAQTAQQCLWGIWNAADIIVLTRAEFDRRKSIVGSLPSIVVSEGSQIYAA